MGSLRAGERRDLLALARAVPERVEGSYLGAGSEKIFGDETIYDFRNCPESMWARPGESQPNRAALAKWGAWVNTWARREYGRPLFIVCSADLAESTNIAGFAKVHWLSNDELEGVPSWSVEQCVQALDQLEHVRLPLPEGGPATKPVVAGLDPQGLTLRQEQSLWRVMFPAVLRDPSALAAAIAQLNE